MKRYINIIKEVKKEGDNGIQFEEESKEEEPKKEEPKKEENMKNIINSNDLIPFLNQKNKADLKYTKNSTIERKELLINEVKSANEEDGTVWCTITTQDIDRMGDIVLSKGIDTSEFQKIPSVFVNHNYSALPVGACTEMVHKDNSVEAKIKFALNVPESKDVFDRIKAGILRGVSIGFNAGSVALKGCKEFDEHCKSLNLSLEHSKSVRRIISKWTMYEFSICGMPANPNCMIKSIKELEDPKDPKEDIKEDTNEKPNEEATKPEDKEAIKEDKPLPENPEAPKDEPEEPKEEPKEVINKDILEDGRAKESSFTAEQADAEQLRMGIEVEMEHTKNIEIAKRIALDHLSEIKDYYTRLAKMEEEAKNTEEVEEVVEEPKEAPKEEPKSIKRYINVIQTPEYTDALIEKTVEARLKGRTRIQISIV